MDASLLTGASVRLAAQSEDEGGGGGSGDAPVIGKFSGAVIAGEGPSAGFLADAGGDLSLANSPQIDPQLYPTGARTFTTMRVTAVGGGDPSLPITVTLYKNGAATAQHVVIPAGTAAGTVLVDSSHPIAFTANQKFDVFASTTGSISGSLAISVTLEGAPGGGGGGGGGGGSVDLVESTDGSVNVTNGGGPTVDLSVPAQFGADTLIQLPNSASTLVKALELIASIIPPGTPGSENSQWLLRTLLAGAQVDTLLLKGFQALFLDGTNGEPGIGFQSNPATGFFYDEALGGSGLPIAVQAGSSVFTWVSFILALISNAGVFQIGLLDSLCQIARVSNDGGCRINVGNDDFQILQAISSGDPPFTPAGATSGFIDFPTFAAPPTAAPTTHFGALTPTAFATGALWSYIGGEGWLSQRRSGKGADVASAGTLILAPADRTRFDYFHLTGSTAADFLSYLASDVYGAIDDGEEIVFYCVAGLTFNFETGSPPANAYPFKTVGGIGGVIPAGGKICFRRDDALGFWVEMWRNVA